MRLLVILLVAMLAACGQEQQQRNTTPTPRPGNSATTIGYAGDYVVYRFHDDNAHVTCWVLEGHGISCLPDAQVGGGR